MDDHWPVRNVFYERLRCWHLAWDSKLLSWQFDNTSIFWNKKKSYRLFLWLISSKKYEKKFQCRNRHPPKSSNSFQETCRGPIHVWDKKGMYKFSQKCTKGLKNVQNLDARFFVIFYNESARILHFFATQLHLFCSPVSIGPRGMFWAIEPHWATPLTPKKWPKTDPYRPKMA